MVNLNHPDREENLNIDDAIDALNLQEQQDELYERFLFPGNIVDRGDSLATLINNHSIMIKSKESKGTEELLREMKITEDTDGTNIQVSTMDIEHVERTEKKRQDLAVKTKDQEDTHRSKFEPKKQQELENMWSEFVGERKRKLERKWLLYQKT